MMKRANVTYGRLDEVLCSLGFTCRKIVEEPAALRYEHAQTGALISLPPSSKTDFVYAHHLLAARTTLENFGIADPNVFDANRQKAG